MNTKRLEACWLLRDAAWALKTYADRIERCEVSPSAENEAKAATWRDRARQRLQRFVKARRQLIAPKPVMRTPFMGNATRIVRNNPWRAGPPPANAGRIKALIDKRYAQNFNGSSGIINLFADSPLVFLADSWRPA